MNKETDFNTISNNIFLKLNEIYDSVNKEDNVSNVISDLTKKENVEGGIIMDSMIDNFVGGDKNEIYKPVIKEINEGIFEGGDISSKTEEQSTSNILTELINKDNISSDYEEEYEEEYEEVNDKYKQFLEHLDDDDINFTVSGGDKNEHKIEILSMYPYLIRK